MIISSNWRPPAATPLRADAGPKHKGVDRAVHQSATQPGAEHSNGAGRKAWVGRVSRSPTDDSSSGLTWPSTHPACQSPAPGQADTGGSLHLPGWGGGLPAAPSSQDKRTEEKPTCSPTMVADPAALGLWGPEAEGISSEQTSCLLPRIFSLIKDHGNVS